MALDATNTYGVRVDDTDPNMPLGKAINITGNQQGTGTPVDKEWVNDNWGFLQAILDQANISPSGSPDNISVSQYLQGLDYRYGATLLDTIENLNTLSPLLDRGQVAIFQESGLFKVGDGTTSWLDLPLQGMSERLRNPIVSLYNKNKIVDSLFNVSSYNHTRATSATYEDRTGVVRTAGIDQQRIEKEGALFETDATNLAAFSSPNTSNGWTSQNVSLTPNNALSVDLNTTASKMEVTTSINGSTALVFRNDGMLSAGLYTVSFDVKSVVGTQWVTVQMEDAGDTLTWFDIVNGTVGTIGADITDGKASIRKIREDNDGTWFRISLTFSAFGVDTTPNVFLNIVSGDGDQFVNGTQLGQYIYTDYYQLERGYVSTSRIKTTGSPTLRAKDVVDLGIENNVSLQEMSVYCTHTQAEYLSSQANPFGIISLGDGTLNGSFSVIAWEPRGLYSAGQGGSQANINIIRSTQDYQKRSVTGTLDGSLVNDGWKCYVDNDSDLISGSTSTWDLDKNNLAIGRRSRQGSSEFNLSRSWLSNLRVYDFVLTQKEHFQLAQLYGDL